MAIVSGVTQKVSLLNGQVAIDGLLLLFGLVRSFLSLRKTSQKTNKRTKIVNIVEEKRRNNPEPKNRVTHLFDELSDE